MKLFQSKALKPKATLSLKEKVFQSERRELNAIATSRFEHEKDLKKFLSESSQTILDIKTKQEEAEKVANERIALLRQEIASLENKKNILETSADEQAYKKRRDDFYKLEREVSERREQLNASLADVEKSKTSLAFIIQEHEESERELSEDKARFNDLRKREVSKIEGQRKVLEDKQESLRILGLSLEERSARLDELKSSIDAQKLINETIRESLAEKQDKLNKDRKALQDAYKELEKSRNRLLDRST